ncbi:MAG: carboxypeptidase regulatory-like domain-containing protein, partial [Thermoplasmata archaeon]
MPERSTYRGIRRRPGTESSWIAAAAVLAVLVIPGGVALAHSPRPAASAAQVLMIYQSPQNITEHDALTVSMHLASSSSVQQVYFTFCQLTSALCYLPVPMDAIGSNWYRGTTGPMSGYHGMDPGVVGGYNITIVYSDNSTSAAPILPNPFSNLTVVQSVTGENMYRMAVMSLVYDVSGHVVERASGAPVVGADVTLSAGNVSSTTTNSLGVYTFTNVTAGNY